MRKFIFLILLVLITLSVQAYDEEDYWKARTFLGAQNKNLDPIYKYIAWAGGGGTELGTGSKFYVDSAVANEGDGTSPTKAKDTLDEAVALCTNDAGDVIYVMQNHAETWTAINSADLDVNGISVIGLGVGTNRPTFTYTTATAGELVIAAVNVTIRNLVFQSGIANVVHAIEVEADADGSVIEFCEFLSGTTDAFEFVDAIQPAAGANDLIIRYNKATETTAGAVSWLDITAGVTSNMSVYGNNIYGDYSTGIVDATGQAHTTAYFGFNTMTNLSASDYAFYFNAAATGVIEFNRIYTDAEASAIDPGNMIPFENYVSTAVDKSGMITPVYDDGTTQLNATTVTAIANAVDALNGIGMIGICQANSGGAEQVVSATLGGYGNSAFVEGWSLICIFDTGGTVGTAPSGEVRDVEAYTSSGGIFTVDPDFTVEMTAGDFVLLTPTHLIPPSYGRIVYCDDGGSDGEATNWVTAKITLAKAITAAAAGDTILVGESHSESLTTGGDTLAKAGVSIIGMGNGDTRPLFIMTASSDELTLNAAGITLKNVRFQPSSTAQTSCIVLGANGDGVTIENVSFIEGVAPAGVDEWVDVIQIPTTAVDATIKNCTYYNTQSSGHVNSFVDLSAATISNASVIGCTIFGDFAEAPIWSDAVPTNILIKGNVISNTQTGKFAIEFQGAATGVISGNVLYADTFGSVLDPGSAKCSENYATNAINTAAHLVPSIDDKLAAVGPGRIFYVDSETPGAGDGRTWATAMATLDAAIDLSTVDDRGDTIYIAAGHTETVTSDFADIDAGGLTIIGLGNGKLRPYFDYTTGTTSSLLVEADDILIKNLWFHANIDSIAVAIEVKTGSLDVTIEDCLFTTQSATDEFDICIDHAAGNHGAVVRNCNFQMGAGNAVSAIHFIDSDYAIIEDNITAGDYSTACIHNETTASDHILIRGNELFNGTIGGGENSEPGIELLGTTSGMIVNNNVVCLLTTPELAIVAAHCYLFDNHYNGLEAGNSEDIGLEVGKVYTRKMTSDFLASTDQMYTVAGGAIEIISLFGQITVVVASTPGDMAIQIDATAGTAEYDAIFAPAITISDGLLGDVIVFTDTIDSSTLTATANKNAGQNLSWFCPAGEIELTLTNTGTGNVLWYMSFRPLDAGVTVTPQ